MMIHNVKTADISGGIFRQVYLLFLGSDEITSYKIILEL